MKHLEVKLKGLLGKYAIGECGIVDLHSYEIHEHDVENISYKNFDKRELFWTIYDQIIIPTRERMGTDPDHSMRLLFIEEGNKLVFHFNIDDYDEMYSEITDVNNMSLEEVIKIIFDDLKETINNLPDDEPMKKAFTWNKSRVVSIPIDCIERLERDVFYSSWVIDNKE